MYNQKSSKKVWVIIVLLLLVVGVIFLVINRGAGDKPRPDARERNVIKQRREVAIQIITAISKHTESKGGTPPPLDEVEKIVTSDLGKVAVDPSSQKAFVFRSTAPSASNHIQYAPKNVCTSNLYALQPTNFAGNVAIRMQDELTGFFCISNRNNASK